MTILRSGLDGIAFSALLAAMCAPSAVMAQSGDDADVAMNEIIVTAQKRDQNLRDVPIAITAMSGEMLQEKGLNNVTDLPDLVPGVRMNTPGGGSNVAISIRGIGQQDVGLHQEAPVATFVDGAYISLSPAIAQPIFDVERVEVLKGPQGTLFGRNATGGLIHFITKRPSTTFDGYVTAEYGSYDKFKVDGAVGGGLGGDWSGRFSFHAETGGNYIHNLVGEDHNGVTSYAGRAQLLYDPGDGFSVLASLYGVSWPDQPGPVGSFKRIMLDATGTPIDPPSFADYQAFCTGLIGSAPTGGGPLGNCFGSQPDAYHANVAPNTRYQGEYWNATLTVEADLNDAIQLTSISNYQRMRDNRTVIPLDVARAEPTLLFTNVQPKADQYSQEVRLSGDFSSGQWVAGVYGLYIDNLSGNNINLWSLPQYGVALDSRNRTKTTSIAGFAEVTYEVSPQLSFILGGRLTRDHKEAVNNSGCTTNPAIPVDICGIIEAGAPVPLVQFAGYDLSFGKTSWSGRAVAQYKPSRDVMLYAGVNRGTKAGGFNSGGAQFYPVFAAQFGQETLTNYEAGIKGVFLDRKLSVDMSAFYYDYKDYQTFSSVNAALQVFNVDAVIKGFEYDLMLRPVSGLELRASGSYLDTKQKDVPLPTGGTSDFPMPNAPKFSAQFSERFSVPLGTGELYEMVTYSRVGKRSNTAIAYAPEGLPAYDRWDLRVGYDLDRFSLAFSVRNFTDELIYTSRVPFEALNGFSYDGVDLPRWYSVSLTYRM